MQMAFADLQSSLSRVRNLANDASANTQAALSDPALLERHETAMSAVVVTLSGFFESFLRQTAEEYASQIELRNYPFNQLKPSIRYAHYQGGGKLLTAIGGKKRSNRHNWTTTDAVDLSERLRSASTGLGYQLVWEAFAETKGNPGPDVIKEFLARFGVAKPLDTLAVHVGLSSQSIVLTLGSFIGIRNECAHSGQANQTPQPSEVLSYCDLIERLAGGIVSTLSSHNVHASNTTTQAPAQANTTPVASLVMPGLTGSTPAVADRSVFRKIVRFFMSKFS